MYETVHREINLKKTIPALFYVDHSMNVSWWHTKSQLMIHITHNPMTRVEHDEVTSSSSVEP